jgi:group I intron endonuclease
VVIYLITNAANGKLYVGRTVLPLSVRWSKHKADAKRRVNYYLYRAMNKYGLAHFSISVLSEHETEEELNEAETQWIAKLHTDDPTVGYNMTAGGDGISGYTMSAETRKKISASCMGRPSSEIQKAAVSLAHKGKPKPPEQRLKMAAHWDEDRRDVQGAIARRVNAVENLKLKDYCCSVCGKFFNQVPRGVFGGHRKGCLHRRAA